MKLYYFFSSSRIHHPYQMTLSKH